MIKLLGILDIITAMIFWASVLIPMPEILLGIFGVYILAKGLVFVGFGLDFFSFLDIVSGFIIIVSISVLIHPLIISVVSVYLIAKGFMSLV